MCLCEMPFEPMLYLCTPAFGAVTLPEATFLGSLEKVTRGGRGRGSFFKKYMAQNKKLTKKKKENTYA